MTIEILLNALPGMDDPDCYKYLNDNLYYLEDIKDSQADFKNEYDYWNLCIQNPTAKSILFLENEFGIMRNINSKKCDWVFIENDKICFVESKDVKPRSRTKERKDATKQLIATLEYYNSNVDLSTEKLHAVICFKSKSKIIKPGDQARKLLFKENYNAEFFEANVLEF